MLAVLLTLLAISVGPTAADVPSSERRALMELYNSTHGTHWTNRSGWGSSQSVCDWYGVRCGFPSSDATRPVVSGLSLDCNNLDGELPSSIDDLTHLETLSIVGNKLRGRLSEVLMERWDHQKLELNASENAFSNTVVRAKLEYSASSVLCSPKEDVHYRLEVDETKGRARFQSMRCVNAESRETYCLVREGDALPLLRFSRGLASLGFAKLHSEYDFPFTATTHGVFLTTEAEWGNGTKTSVRTYARQGPIEAWSAQQLFLGLLGELEWDRESQTSRCDFEK